MATIFETVHKALLPLGDAWKLKDDGDLDKVLQASAENHQEVKDFLQQLQDLRNPLLSLIFEDLEKEFGIAKNEGLTETERRAYLKVKMFSRGGTGTNPDLQTALDDAGFDLLVHDNDPAVDPAIFLDESFQMVAGGGNAFAGRADAFAARVGGEIITNGDLFNQQPSFASQADGAATFAGNSQAVAGFFVDSGRERIIQPIPVDPEQFPLVFFVGGPATRDPITGELLEIELAEIPTNRRIELIKIILKIKPLHTFAGLVIAFI